MSRQKRCAASPLAATMIIVVFILRLYGRTRSRAIGTIDTAITGFWLKHSMTLLAFVEPLTRIRRHDFRLCVAANWTN